MKNILIIISILVVITACTGNNNSQNDAGVIKQSDIEQNSTTSVSDNSFKNDDSVESVDIYALNYDLRESTPNLSSSTLICSKNNTYCATFPYSSIGGAYAAGYTPGVNSWVTDEVAAEITINFNQNVDNGFKVADAGIILSANSDPVGELISFDSSDCDNLVLNGYTQGKSCKIAFIYKALQTNNLLQTIHIKLTTNNNDTLDFPITVQNYYMTNQNLPIINDANISNLFFQAPQIINNSIFFNNNIDNQFELKNVGTKDLIGTGNHTPTINVKLSNKHGENFQSMFYLNNLATNIGDGGLLADKSTFFPFSYTFYKDSNNAITSPFGRFVYSYSNGMQVVNYIKSFILSNGIIQPININANYNGSAFYLVRQNLDLGLDEDDLLSYAPNLNNFKLSVVYNSQIAVDTSKIRLPYVEYSIGTYNNGLTPENIANKISFDFDANCIQNGFDVNQDNDNLLGRTCKVSLKYNGDPYADMGYKKPFSGLLIATYDSPIGNYPIKQIIGKITMDISAIPSGEYLANCKDVYMDSNIVLHGSCLNQTNNYVATQLNYLDCTRNGKTQISNINGELQCSN